MRSVADSVRVDIRKLDHLMNVVGELALVRSAVTRVVDQLQGESVYRQSMMDLDRIGRSFERQLSELRTGILDVRMVPLGQVFNKLARIVRQAAREHDKQVRLVVTGADTEVDKLIVEELTDPLMHLVRNAIDHGIETPGVRERTGKRSEGTLALNAYQKGSNVVIEVEDDGGGMNVYKLRDTAVSRGLLSSDVGQELTRQELLNLVFLPGLSTSSQVTELSGRGVGMDVVKTNILRMGGMINLASEEDIGTKVTITLPITLAIIRALIVTVASRTFALPITAVREAITYARERREDDSGSRGHHPSRRNTRDLRPRPAFRFPFDTASDGGFVVVGAMGNRELGFVVDELHGQEDVIIKSLGPSLSSVKGVRGRDRHWRSTGGARTRCSCPLQRVLRGPRGPADAGVSAMSLATERATLTPDPSSDSGAVPVLAVRAGDEVYGFPLSSVRRFWWQLRSRRFRGRPTRCSG